MYRGSLSNPRKNIDPIALVDLGGGICEHVGPREPVEPIEVVNLLN